MSTVGVVGIKLPPLVSLLWSACLSVDPGKREVLRERKKRNGNKRKIMRVTSAEATEEELREALEDSLQPPSFFPYPPFNFLTAFGVFVYLFS